MKVALYGQKTHTSLGEIINPFLEKLTQRNIEFSVEECFLKILKEFSDYDFSHTKTFSNYESLDKENQLFFTFGGDGTILSAMTYIQDTQIPIVGVNTGRLGFLATINKNVFIEKLDSILDGNYNILSRSLLNVQAKNIDIGYDFALNEVAVSRKETTSMITIDAYMNGEFLNSFWADGLIVSTPTGSTGYSLSCGGPIVHPQSHNFVITPVAPHNLNVRPFVISDDSVIDLKVKSRVPNYFLSLDSRNISLSTDIALRIQKEKFLVNIIRIQDSSYLDTLRDKLLWGVDKRN